MDHRFESQRAAWLDRHGGPFAQSRRRAELLRRRSRDSVRGLAGAPPDFQSERIVDASWARAWSLSKERPGEFAGWVLVWGMIAATIGPTLICGRVIYGWLDRGVPSRRTRMPMTQLAIGSALSATVIACMFTSTDFRLAWGPWITAWLVVNIASLPISTTWFAAAWGWWACRTNAAPSTETKIVRSPQEEMQDEHGTWAMLPTFEVDEDKHVYNPPAGWLTPADLNLPPIPGFPGPEPIPAELLPPADVKPFVPPTGSQSDDDNDPFSRFEAEMRGDL